MMKRDGLIAGVLGGVAAIIYFASLADYAFPGASAHLMALWQGLNVAAGVEYPLMAFFAKLLGGGNLIAPVCGVLSVVFVYAIVKFFVTNACVSEEVAPCADSIGRVAAISASLVFMLTPAVRESATHLEPRLFDACWLLGTFTLMVPYLKSRVPGPLFATLFGVLMALGFCDSAVFIMALPLAFAAIVFVELRRENKPYLSLTLFTLAFLIAFAVARRAFGVELTPFLKSAASELKDYFVADRPSAQRARLFVALFATVPFVVSIFSLLKTFSGRTGIVQWFFHGAMTFISILAIATPFSPSSLLLCEGAYPVVASAFVAMFSGYLAAFWWLHRKEMVGVAAGVVYAFVILFTLAWNLFTFDGRRGAYADETARKILADLGKRTWFVSDGTLDDHLLLQAHAAGQELHLISLQRDLDDVYLEALGKVVAEKGIGGSKNGDLALSLKLGVLPFVQDWFAADPSVAKEVAIYGAPDLWYSAGLKPVPEFLFFGAEKSVAPDWEEWKRFDALLSAPKGWGSYGLYKETDPIDIRRLSIRRHLGLVANNRGVWLQDEKKDDEAFDFYELVLGEIDTDNICSLFNEIEMSGRKYAKALAKKRELERRLKAIVDDKNRRYLIWRLGTFYGYVRNPDMFIRLGFTWARSGRPGEALTQIRRAIDFVPTEKRTALFNLMADLYSAENAPEKSQRIYDAVLKKDPENHDALIGLMRLKLAEGDVKGALAYLERAVNASPAESRRARIELAMVEMMRNDLEGAKANLQKVTDENPKDLQAWSLLAAIAIQQYDTAKDEATKSRYLSDIRDHILPEMERQAADPHNYFVQTTRAFLLMRQGTEKRREARDAFEAASRANPGASATHDLVLSLDISLDDRENAERHARDVLRRNRNAPLANYVMGSMALQRAEYREAETFLRRAVATAQPTVIALNDLAEVLRRLQRLDEAETFIRQAIEKSPNFYILHQTLGEILIDADRNLDEAEKSIRHAMELSKGEKGGVEDIRLYTSLARVQLKRGDKKGARGSIRRVEAKSRDLSDFEKRELEEIKKSVR